MTVVAVVCFESQVKTWLTCRISGVGKPGIVRRGNVTQKPGDACKCAAQTKLQAKTTKVLSFNG